MEEAKKFRVRDDILVSYYLEPVSNDDTHVVWWIEDDGTRESTKYRADAIEKHFADGTFKFVDVKPQDIQGTHTSALDKQVSGNHYKDCGIQPIEYIHANGLNYFEGNAVKYITRHRKKNGKADIEKAIHYLELLLEMEYKEQ
jgi:hypothetical protein